MHHYHIEVAHIYADQPFGRQQAVGVELALNAIQRIGRDHTSVMVLIDDIHVKEGAKLITPQEVVDQVGALGLEVDQVIMESALEEAVFLQNLKSQVTVTHTFDRGRRSQQGLVYDNQFIAMFEDGRPTCATLSAVCMLGRLAKCKPRRINFTDRIQVGDRLLTILPQRFMRVEEKARIIMASYEPSWVNRCEYVFY